MSSIQPIRSLLRAQRTLVTRRLPASTVPSIRPFSGTAFRSLPYKDDQDRESLNPRSSEHTKSSTDDAAADSDAAFDPSKTSPESEKNTASKESGGNPLDVSGASQGVSKPQGERDKEKEFSKGGTNKKKSAGGSPEKRGTNPQP